MSSELTSGLGRIIIIGAGPTGLGAAYRLAELGHTDFVVLDRATGPGGLASSVVDAQGFVWDIGGHVQFSHYDYYDDVVDRALGGQWLTHQRESWVWIRGRFVPYPFQNNLHRLDPVEVARAVEGLEAAAATRESMTRPRTFGDWITSTFGEGIADIFMRPYNLKVWAYPLDEMSVGWMGERVAVPDLEKIRGQVAEARDDISWGPNRTFRFPVWGGTGAIWTGVASMLPPERLRFSAQVTAIDADAGIVRLNSGEALRYDALITTMPLDQCCRMLGPMDPAVARAATTLRYSSVHILGVGLRGPRPEALAHKCWMYFPESNSPYYRVTVFSNYSPNNVPSGEGYWSLMAEVSESSHKPVAADRLVEEVIAALIEDELVPAETEVVSRWYHRERHGYPTPFLGRDETLSAIRPWLEARRIFSRGRFGAWKYEVSNQDHSFMQGVEVVDRLAFGQTEPTLDEPDAVNAGTFRSVRRTRRDSES